MYRKYRSLLCNVDRNFVLLLRYQLIVSVAKLKQRLTEKQPSPHPHLAHYQARINCCLVAHRMKGIPQPEPQHSQLPV